MSQQKKQTEQTAVPVQKKQQPTQAAQIGAFETEQFAGFDAPTSAGILDLPESNSLTFKQSQVLRMQKQHGNGYVQRFLQNRTEPAPKPKPSIPSLPKINHHPVQAKLSVNEPDDAYEKEADAVADAVMRMPAPATPPPPSDDENKNKTQQTTPSISRLQRKGDGIGGQDVSSDVASKIASVQSSSGKPLPDSERDFFEPRMGVDLSDVRVHDGETAVQTAHDLNAKAYTVGSDIVFNKGEYAPGSDSGRKLLAHELTHTVQQGAVQRSPIQRMTISPDGSVAFVQRWPSWDDVKEVGGNIVDGAMDLGGDLLSGAADMLGIDFDSIADLVAHLAPSLAELIRNGPIGMLTEEIEAGIDSWVGNLTNGANLDTVVAELQTNMSSTFTMFQGVFANDPTACANFANSLNQLNTFIEDLTDNPLIQRFQEATDQLTGIITTITDLVIAPVFDTIMEIAGDVFNKVSELAETIWGWTEPIRNVLSAAWDWVKEQLGMAADGAGDVLDFLTEKASEAWNAIKEKLAPVLEPLQTVGQIALMVTPIGWIGAMVQYGPQLIEAIQWLWANKDNPDIIESAHQEMGHTILPQLLTSLESTSGAISSVVTEFVSTITELGSGLISLLEGVTGIPFMSMGKNFVQLVSDGIQKLVTWAQTALPELATDIATFFQKVYERVEPYIGVLMQIGIAIVNPATIPMILLGEAWQRLDDCYKGPIIDFLLKTAIAFLEAMPEVPLFGLLWSMVKSGVLGFLNGMLAQPLETKITVTNKIAKIISFGSVDFIVGFVKGFLKGIWEGLTDPFQLIFMAIQGLGNIISWLNDVANEALEAQENPEAEQATAPAMNDMGAMSARMAAMAGELEPDVDEVVDGFQPAVEEYFSGSGEDLTFDTLMEKFGEAWGAIESALYGAGESLANKLCEFFMQDAAEGQMGESLGWLAGTIIFEVVLTLLTAGAWAPVSAAGKALKLFARVLDWTGELMGVAFKSLKRVGELLLDALQSLRKFLDKAGGAIGRFLDALGNIGRKIQEFADELLARFRRGPADEVTGEGIEKGGREGLEEFGDELAERPIALGQARIIAETHDVADAPIPAVLGSLNVLKARYKWIDGFSAQPKSPGHYRLIMREDEIDGDYTTSLLVNGQIPSVRDGEFDKWFDALTPDELEQIWANPQLRKSIEGRLRHPGGFHEWLPVARAPQFKRWGITSEQIKDLRSLTRDVKFVNPRGRHGGLGSTTAHNEIFDLIDTSLDYSTFKKRLKNWAHYRLENGIDDLPEGLR